MNWFREHTRAAVLSAVVFLLLVLTVVSYVNRGSDSWLGSQIERGVAFIQEPVSAGGEGLADTFRGLFQFRKVLAENQSLKEEIDRLNQELMRQSLKEQELEELRSLSEGLRYVSRLDGYDYRAADVIAMDSSDWFTTFTINAGTEQGVRENSAVINGDGLVGRVLTVGEGWAKVISVIDESNNVSFKVYRDMSILGVLYGNGSGALSGYLLDPEAGVIEGDMLITSGMEIYPEGIVIGTVTEVIWDNDALLKRVEVEPAVFFRDIPKVAVLTLKDGLPAAENGAGGQEEGDGGEDEI